MYTVKRAGELVGVSSSTLRAWERRYGLDVAHRTPAGYRMYDDAAVDALRMVRGLVEAGWAASEAVAEVRRRSDRLGDLPSDADPGTMVEFAERFDADGMAAVLNQHLMTASFESVADSWLMPGLREVGEAWSTGHVTVAGEHLVAHTVKRRLAAEYDTTATVATGPRVLIGLPPGARHDLGLLSFATAARRVGMLTTYLGADVPVDDWVAGAKALDTDAVVLAAPMAEDLPGLVRVVAAVHAALPDVVIAVGGAQQDLAPPACLQLGHRIGPAATQLKTTLQPHVEDRNA